MGLLLAALYDHSSGTTHGDRWRRLRRRLRFCTLKAKEELAVGLLLNAVLIAAVAYFPSLRRFLADHLWLGAAALLAPWVPYAVRWWRVMSVGRRAARAVRVMGRSGKEMRRALMRFSRAQIDGQPVADLQGSDARYDLLSKFQAVLKRLGYHSVVVIVDRVDEPDLKDLDVKVTWTPAEMHNVLRPIYDLKFLTTPGFGIKLLLPRELYALLAREAPEFHQRARLDKQNLIPSLVWTGPSLCDLVNERLRASAAEGSSAVTLRGLLDDSIKDDEIINTFGRMRIPRSVFKFMFRLLTNHCMSCTGDQPQWTISRETWTTTWAVFSQKDLEHYDQGLMMG